ncbi:LpxI family protein [Magnetococcus sp. PR-3]|uniref:LpxI family protein n=1 Tax=Magnetococcus sp. PR-3 TaxID=3120355 RepID=UPI002FCE3838
MPLIHGLKLRLHSHRSLPVSPGGKRVGIIAGNGQIPSLVIQKIRSHTDSCGVVVAAHRGEAEPELEQLADATLWVRLGQFKRIIRFFKAQGVTHIVMVGGITKTKIWNIRPDTLALKIASRLRHMQDDHLLRAIAETLESYGFSVCGAHELVPELLAPAGVLGSYQPDESLQADFTLGWNMAKAVGALDIGQGVVVRDKVVLAVEAVEGTDAMLKRAGELTRGGGCLVKVSKPQQDLRLDMPTVGVSTIKNLHQAGLTGLAIEAGATMIVDFIETVAEADRLGVVLMGCEASQMAEDKEGKLCHEP